MSCTVLSWSICSAFRTLLYFLSSMAIVDMTPMESHSSRVLSSTSGLMLALSASSVSAISVSFSSSVIVIFSLSSMSLSLLTLLVTNGCPRWTFCLSIYRYYRTAPRVADSESGYEDF